MEGNVITAEEVKTVWFITFTRWSCIYAFISITSSCTQLRLWVKAIGEQKKKTLNNFSVKKIKIMEEL